MRDIIKRYLKITVFIVAVLITMNSIFIKIWLDDTDNKMPRKISQFLNGITISDDTCLVDKESINFIEKNYEWMIVLNSTGKNVYSYKVPDELNRDYSIGEIADCSKWYIEDYPVEMINAPSGLVIIGNKYKSLWKKCVSIKTNNGIHIVTVIVVLNMLVTVILSYFFSMVFMKDLKSVISGIFDVAEDKGVKLQEKGYLGEISKAINKVSKRLIKQKELIKRNDKMKDEWLVGISHDIRTPLAVIVGKVEELENIEVNEEKIHYLEIIKNQSFKIKYLVNDLNLIRKLDNNLFQINAKTIDINRLLRECIADVMNMYEQDNYEFALDGEEKNKKLYIYADEHLLKRAFENILINSIVHNEQGCKISINVKNRDSFIKIVFEDNGIGISEEKLKELNCDIKKDINSIHGWGTVVVKRIVELHNGKTKFNRTSKGMQVFIIIPIKS